MASRGLTMCLVQYLVALGVITAGLYATVCSLDSNSLEQNTPTPEPRHHHNETFHYQPCEQSSALAYVFSPHSTPSFLVSYKRTRSIPSLFATNSRSHIARL
ncbi:hypothetical protein F5Y06DRAFT_33661 [Hypoxylon sp. FL0890]|nr:hypothetical protein F5Y06DRAFT_33661 [Hypoxylon sp. FL0890]